jgi:3-phenylpropionate/cinnamic acid dioxygenase small subunit
VELSAETDADALRRLVRRSDIEALVVEYAYRLDRGDFAGLLELFTEDCEFASPRAPYHQQHWDYHRGKSALAKYYALPAWENPRRKMRHLVTNIRLSHLCATKIEGTIAVTGYRDESEGPSIAAPAMVGDYEDLYRRDPGQPWRIARRKVVISFLAASLIAEHYPAQWRLDEH